MSKRPLLSALCFATVTLVVACGPEASQEPTSKASSSSSSAKSGASQAASTPKPSATVASSAPATTASAMSSATAEPTSSAGAGAAPPPWTSFETIPSGPVKAVFKGKPYEGFVVPMYVPTDDKIELSYYEGKAPEKICPPPALGAGSKLVKVQMGKGFHDTGKVYEAKLDSKDKSIATDKVYVSFGEGAGSFSNPGYEGVGFVYKVESFEKPGGAEKPGKIKIKFAAVGRFLLDDPTTWMAGEYDGPLCSY